MISKAIEFGGRTLFADKSETDEDDRHLETLARIWKHLAASSEKTGMYVVLEHEFNGRRIVVFHLRRPVQLTDGEVISLKKTIEEMKRSEKL